MPEVLRVIGGVAIAKGAGNQHQQALLGALGGVVIIHAAHLRLPALAAQMLGAAVGEAFGIAGLGAVQQVNAGASGERRYGFACAAAE